MDVVVSTVIIDKYRNWSWIWTPWIRLYFYLNNNEAILTQTNAFYKNEVIWSGFNVLIYVMHSIKWQVYHIAYELNSSE